jgi:hypothetical protein
VRGRDVLDDLARRVEQDFRLVFPDARASFVDEGVKVELPGHGWAFASVWVDPMDELTTAEAEELVASTADDLFENGWPDAMTEPWPTCPRHPDHLFDHPGRPRDRQLVLRSGRVGRRRRRGSSPTPDLAPKCCRTTLV